MTGRPLHPAEAAGRILGALDRGRSACLIVIVASPDPEQIGRRMVFLTGECHGTLGDGELDRAASRFAEEALDATEAREGTCTVDRSPGPVTLYLEAHQPRPELLIVGAGHLAQPLSTVGRLLGFRVTVADDRPEFATLERFPDADRVEIVDFRHPFDRIPLGPWTHLVLVTRGHVYDYECLRHALRADHPPRYIGMIGSRRRVRATFAQLRAEGIPSDRIGQVRAPIGLDLGAETPGEIAIAVAAELVLSWRGGTGRSLREVEKVAERFFPEEPDS